jgi:AraC-like DNA-binding protein
MDVIEQFASEYERRAQEQGKVQAEASRLASRLIGELNPKISMRALAKRIGYSVSLVSAVFRQQRNVPPRMLTRLVEEYKHYAE